MRVAVLCQGTVLQPALAALHSQGLLAGLGVPDRLPEIHLPLEQAARQAGIPFARIKASGLEEQLTRWLEESNPDVVCTMGFHHKIPGSVLEQPRLGFFNFHGGALPGYRGPGIKNFLPGEQPLDFPGMLLSLVRSEERRVGERV